MSNVTFKGFKASEIEFINKHDNGQKIEFENTYSYNVKYARNNTCVCELTAEMKDKAEPDKFRVKIVIIGFFEFNPEVQKEIIHVETFKELFPYARAAVSTVTTSAGVPPVILPGFDIESQNIYRFGNN